MKTSFYHGSSTAIEKITKDGLFGSGLFFGQDLETGRSHGGVTPWVYRVDIDPDEILEACALFHDDGWEKIDHLPKNLAKELEIEEELAEGLIDETANRFQRSVLFDLFPDKSSDFLADLSWKLQKIAGEAAIILGFRGVALDDEHGTSYLIDMLGREKELHLVESPEPPGPPKKARYRLGGVPSVDWFKYELYFRSGECLNTKP